MEMKKETPTPAGYSNVCPYLMVESVELQAQFLQTVFGARIKEELKQENGLVQHGEVNLGETVIMMGRARPEWPASPGANYVFVAQVDDVFQKALAAGAAPLMEPADRFYGYREGGIKDPQGNTWWLAQVLEELSVEEMQARMPKSQKK